MANIEAHKNERIRAKNARLSHKGKNVANIHVLNQFDGLYHEANGVRKFPDGTEVEGANDGVGYVLLHDDDISITPTMFETEQKENEMKEVRAQIAIN